MSGDKKMKTELLLYILIAVMVILVIAVLYLALKLYKAPSNPKSVICKIN